MRKYPECKKGRPNVYMIRTITKVKIYNYSTSGEKVGPITWPRIRTLQSKG